MNQKEKKILKNLTKAWIEFLELKSVQDDIDDFRRAIHEGQRIIMSREAIRNNPELFNRDIID